MVCPLRREGSNFGQPFACLDPFIRFEDFNMKPFLVTPDQAKVLADLALTKLQKPKATLVASTAAFAATWFPAG